jgi:hypothetical protein
MFAKIVMVLVLSMGAAHLCCAGVEPDEFLDERTGATVTVVHDPLVFPLERTLGAKNEQRDFVSLTAVVVDRSGQLQLFFVGYAWSTTDRLTKSLVLRTDERQFELAPLQQFPGELPDDRKLHAPTLWHAQRAAYPVTRELLRELSGARSLKLALSSDPMDAGSEPQAFEVWSGQKSLSAFVDRIGAGQ